MKKVIITRPRTQADDFAEKLCAAGFEPIFFPVIEIRPIQNNGALDQALANLKCYDWIVFTSVNAVEVVFERLKAATETRNHGDEKGFVPSLRDAVANLRVAVIGPKTAAALQSRGVAPDFVPNEYVAESILPGLGDLRDKWVLLPRAEIARKALPIAIAKAGGFPHEIAVYETLSAEATPEGLDALRSGVEVITLTSPSTVENFMAITRQNGLDPLNLPNNPTFACIGPITEQAAFEAGLVNLMSAKEYTTDGLLEAIRSLKIP